MRAEDHFTSTVEGAEAFERHHGEDYLDGPDLADLREPEDYFMKIYTYDQVDPTDLLQPYEVAGGDPDGR